MTAASCHAALHDTVQCIKHSGLAEQLGHLDMYTLICLACCAEIPEDAETPTAGAIRGSGEIGIHRGVEGVVGACGDPGAQSCTAMQQVCSLLNC